MHTAGPQGARDLRHRHDYADGPPRDGEGCRCRHPRRAARCVGLGRLAEAGLGPLTRVLNATGEQRAGLSSL